jgi:hypothetical protein
LQSKKIENLFTKKSVPKMNALLPILLDDKMINNLVHSHRTSIHLAVLVKRNKVIATATNKIGSRSRGAGWSDYTIHAEKNVVKELGDLEQLRGATMYVIRISRCRTTHGMEKVQNSEPCHDCHLFLEKCVKQYGLRRVFYSTSEFVELDISVRPARKVSTVVK